MTNPLAGAWSTLRPPPLLTVSQWADRHRMLDTVSSAEPGKWRTSRTPYLREPMDRLSPTDPCERVVMMFGAQLGKTEAGLNWCGYIIHHQPAPLLLVQPSLEMAELYAEQRMAPMLRSTPELAERVGDPKQRDSGNKKAPLALMRMVPASPDHPSTAKLRLIEAYVETLNVPAEIVWGMNDPIFATALPVMRSYFPQARVTETKAGHFLQEEVPEVVAAAVVRVVSDVETKTGSSELSGSAVP